MNNEQIEAKKLIEESYGDILKENNLEITFKEEFPSTEELVNKEYTFTVLKRIGKYTVIQIKKTGKSAFKILAIWAVLTVSFPTYVKTPEVFISSTYDKAVELKNKLSDKSLWSKNTDEIKDEFLVYSDSMMGNKTEYEDWKKQIYKNEIPEYTSYTALGSTVTSLINEYIKPSGDYI